MNVWVRPMRNKTTHSFLESFGSILTEGRKPEKLRPGKCSYFLNESFQQYREKNIRFYTANKQKTTNQKQNVVE